LQARRRFLIGLLIGAPSIVQASNIMPISVPKPLASPRNITFIVASPIEGPGFIEEIQTN
jgi:hypothetical protein